MIVGLIIIQVLVTAKQYCSPREPTWKSKQKMQNMAYVYDKFDIAQGFNIEDTKDRSQIRLMEMKKITYRERLWRQ